MRNNNCTIKCLLAFTLMVGSPLAAIEAVAASSVEVVQQNGGFYIDVTGNGVRGRLGPGLQYEDTGVRYNKGQHLYVFSQRNGWYEVRSGNETLWITSEFAKRSANQKPDWVTVCVEGPVRLRLGPGGKDSGLRVNYEDAFKYLGEQGNWYKISYRKKVYWISKDCSYAE